MKEKILIVEDEAIIRLFISKTLKQNGFQTFNASNGRKALKILQSEDIDLIVSDIEMPDMDGYHLLQQINENPRTAGIPFFFLTANGTSEAKLQGLKLGVQDYLTKPINSQELILRVKNTLNLMKKNSCIQRSDAELAGKLKSGKLAEIIQFLNMSAQSGCLKMHWENTEGEIWFREGVLHAAVAANDLDGDDAVREMLNQDNGYFYFLERTDLPERNITLDLMHIMLTQSMLKDTRVRTQKEMLVVRFQALCRKISEFYVDGSLDAAANNGLKILEEQISRINFVDILSIDEVEKLRIEIDKIESNIQKLYHILNQQEISLYSLEENLKLESFILEQSLQELNLHHAHREKLIEQLKRIPENPELGVSGDLAKRVLTAYRSHCDINNQAPIDPVFLKNCQPSVAQALKVKTNCRIAKLSELKTFFSRFSALSSWSFKVGFTGLVDHLIPFFQGFSRVPRRFSEISSEPGNPVLLFQRIPVDQSNYLYLIGYPVIDVQQDFKPVAGLADVWGFIHAGTEAEAERLFNREFLLKLMTEISDQRIFLIKEKQKNVQADRIFQLFEKWEDRNTLTITSGSKRAVLSALKFISRPEFGRVE